MKWPRDWTTPTWPVPRGRSGNSTPRQPDGCYARQNRRGQHRRVGGLALADPLCSIHTLFSNIKAWLVGTHHGVSAKHLPRYLREWSYRFNRRNLPDGLDGYLIRRAVECATITDDQLKTGTMPGGADRVRRPPATVAQPAPAG